jgi:hypothetical protein
MTCATCFYSEKQKMKKGKQAIEKKAKIFGGSNHHAKKILRVSPSQEESQNFGR